MDLTDAPLLIDAFCGAGGAGRGYADAGFEVWGIDIKPQSSYPYRFFRGDVFEVLPKLIAKYPVAVVHASPPCQAYSKLTNLSPHPRSSYPDLVDQTRELLRSTDRPWIMENVELSPLETPTMLCGTMFGLGASVRGERRELRRHRFFESNQLLYAPGPCQHEHPVVNVYGNPGGFDRRRGRALASASEWGEAMGIDWMASRDMAQSVPPIFTRFLGEQLLA